VSILALVSYPAFSTIRSIDGGYMVYVRLAFLLFSKM
jgi:hypothetical protein